MIRIVLDGVFINGNVTGLDNVTITLREKDDDKKVSKSFSSELEFYDDGYNLLKTKLIDDPEGFGKSVDVELYDDCCSNDLIFKGEITGDSIDWCENDCFITANVIQKDQETEAAKCIRSTIIYDNHAGFLNKQHPNMEYCIELRPAFIQDLLLIFALLFCLLLILLVPLVAVISILVAFVGLLCEAYNLIPFVDDLNCPPINPAALLLDYIYWVGEIKDNLIGCGRKHPAPLVRDYLNNVCAKCGLTFKSSILNDAASDYYDLVMLSASIAKGEENPSGLIEDNLPVMTGKILLEKLAATFNGDWRVTGGALVFERRDTFIGNTLWIDTFAIGDRLIEDACFSWISEDRPAFGIFKYTQDATDWVGNEARRRYDDIVEWNDPVSDVQEGSKEVLIPFSRARHRDDDIDRDVLTSWGEIGIFNTIFGGELLNSRRVLLLPQHTSTTEKLLIWDGNMLNGRVKRGYTGTGYDPDVSFNYPMWVDATKQNNLYDRFWAIENPKLPSNQLFDFNLKVRYECNDLRSFGFDKYINVIKGGQIVKGIPTEIRIDFKTKTLEITGKI